jgi:hypothetical protein
MIDVENELSCAGRGMVECIMLGALGERECFVGGDHVVTSKTMFAIKNAIGSLQPWNYMIEIATNIQSISFPHVVAKEKHATKPYIE